MKPSVLVLGCGPAGLIAAHAAERFGCRELHIASRKVQSEIHGAQYLHEPISGLDVGDPFKLYYHKKGTQQGYAEKVYGSRSAPVSWRNYREGSYPAWPLVSTYSTLWARWADRITPVNLTGMDLYRMALAYDLIISTIPAQIWCRIHKHAASPFHSFDYATVYFAGIAPDCPVDTIVYNGKSDEPWYRMSNIRGQEFTEYPEAVYRQAAIGYAKASLADHIVPTFKGIKPVSTDCDCPPGNVLRIGRFGAWDKNMLTHHVYDAVTARLEAL